MGLLDFLTKGTSSKKPVAQGAPMPRPQNFSGFSPGQARTVQPRPGVPTNGQGYNLPDPTTLGGISPEQFSDVKYPLPNTEIPQVQIPAQASQPTQQLPPGVTQTSNNFTDIYGNPILGMPDIAKMEYTDTTKDPVIPELNPDRAYTTFNEGVKMTSFDAPQVQQSQTQPEVITQVPNSDLTPAPEVQPMAEPVQAEANFSPSATNTVPVQEASLDFSNPVNNTAASVPIEEPKDILEADVTDISPTPILPEPIQTPNFPTESSLDLARLTEVNNVEPQPTVVEQPMLPASASTNEVAEPPEIDKAMEELNKTINHLETDPEAQSKALTSQPNLGQDQSDLTPEEPVNQPQLIPELPQLGPEVTEVPQLESQSINENLVSEPILDQPAPSEVTPILETQTIVPEPLEEKIENNIIQESSTPETYQEFDLVVLKKLGFIGINSEINSDIANMIKSFLEMSKNSLTKVNLDSTKGYAKDIVESLSNSESDIDGYVLKPYYTNYSDESEMDLSSNKLTLRYYSNYFERLEGIYKESDFFIVPTQKGLVNFASLNTIIALGHMYFGLHKPVFLVGNGWDEYNTYLNTKVANDPNENPFMICATLEELKNNLLKLDTEYAEKEKVNVKRNVIDNRKGHEEAEFLVK